MSHFTASTLSTAHNTGTIGRVEYRIPTEINRFPSQEYSTSEPDAMAQMQQMSQQGGEPVMGMNQDGMIQGPGGPTGHYRDRTSDDDLNDTTPW
ncbi:hypothetical protein VTJ04DRAFT_6653 [Mycothermus thermophilus]|uniref:uncharacterized protein n=1 Tax=Humicola insolens TaxID=85995 RepID=UPI003741F367